MRISDCSSDVCASDLCALRLARFNANLDVDDQPHKSAGFFTGIPSPAGAGVALAPVYLWLVTGLDVFRSPAVTAPVLAATAFLMISNLPTYSWKSIRLPKRSEEHTSELQSLMRISYAVFCLKKKKST